MLKALFSSKARVKLLKIFLLSQEEEFFIRELTRKLDEQINSIRRELDNLKKIGLLRSRVKNRKKYYAINKDFIIYGELKSMFLKAEGADDEIVKKIAKMGEVDLLILSGIFAGKMSSNVDLLIVGEVAKAKLQRYLDEESKAKKDVRFSIFTKKDFLYRLECKDKFILDMIADTTNIVAINKMKKELEGLREEE